MNFTALWKYFKELFNLLFFGIANIQLYFHATKYLSIYFRQISNFFVDLLKRENYTGNKERTIYFEHPVIIGCFQHYKDSYNILKRKEKRKYF